MATRVWIVGSGLLGSAVSRAVDRRHDWTRFSGGSLPWGDPDGVRITASTAVRELLAEAAAHEERWAIIWAAGAAVTSAAQAVLDAELRDFEALIEAIRVEAGASPEHGAMFIASSAGGVYGGSVGLPFTEATVPVPISPYGAFKLKVEQLASCFSAESGISILIGRITNLYGPGQRLEKMQGLVSQLALSFYTRKPLRIYVPLETTRNYIYVDDCAALVLRGMDRLAEDGASTARTIVKVLGSQQNTSISTLLGHLRAIGKRPPGVILGSMPATSGQAIDLRIFSTVWTDLDAVETVPLATGFHATMQDILHIIQR